MRLKTPCRMSTVVWDWCFLIFLVMFPLIIVNKLAGNFQNPNNELVNYYDLNCNSVHFSWQLRNLEKKMSSKKSPKSRLKIVGRIKKSIIYPSIRCTRWLGAWPWRVGWRPLWRTDSCPLPGCRPVWAISENSRIQN